MTGSVAAGKNLLDFGPFRLNIGERLLTRQGESVPLSARAFDLLTALASSPNEVLGKHDLLALVWPDVIVGEGSLRFHMASLRRALRDGKDGARYVATLPGRGYSFVAPVSIITRLSGASTAADNPLSTNLPGRLQRMIGRVECVAQISDLLLSARFVSIVGTGGVGKTTVAIAVGHALIGQFDGAVLFIDFGALADPSLTTPALAAMLGLSVRSDDAISGVVAYLRARRLLLIFDNCEHLIGTVSALAEAIFLAAPDVHLLVTSREKLRVEGEQVYLLESLECAPDDPEVAASTALSFPASELFIERARASGATIGFSDADAITIGHICRKLDGVPLAIELAAGRVGTFGIQEIASLLDERLSLQWAGQRTAPPRHRTLQATLDWSYNLLSGLERVILRQLAIFSGYFTMHAALAVVTGGDMDQSSVLNAIDSLVSKSMVAPRPAGAMMRYRLLDATRAYALDIGFETEEYADLASRHANYYRHWVAQAKDQWPAMSNAAERQPYLSALHNIRAALEWCFEGKGEAGLGVALAAAAAHFFLALSLPTECQRWSERALQALDDTTSGGTDEMLLQAALGTSLMFTHGMHDTARLALLRSLSIAESRGNAINQLQLLGPLHMFHLRMGDYKTSLRYAERSAAVSGAMENPWQINLSHSLLGIVYHLSGNLDAARKELEAAQQFEAGAKHVNSSYLGFDHRLWASTAFARTQWMQGNFPQALERMRQTIAQAESLAHPITFSIVVNWCISVFIWNGDLESAEALIERFIAHVQYHSLSPYYAVIRARKGQVAILQGEPSRGIEILQNCIMEFHATRYELLTTEFNISLAQGLIATDRFGEGLGGIDETIRSIETNGDFSYLPEVLRVKGNLHSRFGRSEDVVEQCFVQSIELARRQGAAAWELRSAIDLAAFLAERKQTPRAQKVLSAVLDERFKDMRGRDIEKAKGLLTSF